MKGFLLSLILHATLLALLFLSKDRRVLPTKPRQTVVEWVEIHKAPDKKNEKKKGRKKAGEREKRGNSLAHAKLSDLLPSSMTIPGQVEHDRRFNHGGDDLYSPDDPSAGWGEGGTEYGRIKDYIKMEKLATAMDGLIEFPHALAYRKMGGVIRARLVLDDEGECNWLETRIQGSRQRLRFYVLMVLKTFCSGDVWHNMKKRQSSNLDFAFHFNVYGDGRSAPQVIGNVITYDLPGYQHRGDWKLGPIRGNFTMPLFAALNPTWIVENWNSLIHSKDPLEDFKDKFEEESKVQGF